MNNQIQACVRALGCAFLLTGAIPLLRSAAPQTGQAPSSQPSQAALDERISMLRKDLRSQRKQIIAQNMSLTEQSATKFWPIYDQYIAELVESNNAKYQLIKEYSQTDSMTDAQADTLAKRWLTVDENVVKLRQKYLPLFRNVLTAKETARFFQIDRQVQMMIDLQLASSLPLLEP